MSGQVQYLTFCLGDRFFGLPLAQAQSVARAVDCTPVPGAPEIVLGILDFHGDILPVMNVRRRFNFEEREIGVDDVLIIARTSKRIVAVAVDGIVGVVDYPAQSVVATETLLPGTQQIAGVIQHSDGLALIHDLDRFLYPEEDQALEKALADWQGHGN
jgi:purine-binding chemotaxis protein CheW